MERKRILPYKRPPVPAWIWATLFVLMMLAGLCMPAAASLLWSSSCDSTTGWTTFSSTTTWPTLTTTTVHGGTGAFQINNRANGIVQTFTGTTGTFRWSGWFYDDTSYTVDAFVTDIRNSTSSSLLAFGVSNTAPATSGFYDARIIGGGYVSTASWYKGSIARSNGWHRFDIVYDQTALKVTWYVDGAQAFQSNTLTGTLSVDRCIIGVRTTATAVTQTLCFDEFSIVDGLYKLTRGIYSGQGTISGSADGYYTASETVTLTATPATNWSFSKWVDEFGFAVSTDNPYTGSLTSDTNFRAVFLPQGVAQTLVCKPDALSPGACTFTGDNTVYNPGDTATATATPSTGYTFVKWSTQPDGSDTFRTTATCTYTINNNTTLYAWFTANPQALTLTANPSGGGTLTGAGTYNTNSDVTVSATVNIGYRFAGWSTDLAGTNFVSTATSYNFKMPGSVGNAYTLYAQYRTYLVFQDDFESGSLSPNWAIVTGTPTVSTTYANSGTHSLAINDLWIRLTHNLSGDQAVPSGSKIALRFWLRDPNDRGGIIDMRNSNTNLLLGAGAYTSASTVYQSRILGAATGTGWTDLTNSARIIAAAPPAAQVWNRFDIYYDGTTNANFYVNGVSRKTVTDINAATVDRLINQLAVGYGFTGTVPAATSYIDDIAVFLNPVFITTGVQAGNGTVSTVLNGNTLKGEPSGLYYQLEDLVLTPVPAPGSRFVNWVAADGTTVVSTDNPFRPVASGTATDTTAKAVFEIDPTKALLTLTASPLGACTFTGGGYQTIGGDVTVVETPSAGYTFVKWSSDAVGTDTLGTSPSYTFTMPGAPTTKYAIFSRDPQTLTIGAYPSAGGIASGAGTFGTGSSVTVSATTNANYMFLYWSTTANGNGPVSAKPSYTFNMPPNAYTLYAIYGKAIFFDGFDARNAGAIDSNATAGPNTATVGDKNDNPWFGPKPTNCSVTVGVTATSVNAGAKMLGAGSGTMNCQNDVNIAYRCNGGATITANFYFDWYFFDPKGTGAGNNTYNDYAALCLYPAGTIDGTTDYISADNLSAVAATQRIAVGAWTASDATKYHFGASAAGNPMTWNNTTVTRSIGWHHGRIAVGASNNVSIYIDDMINAATTLTASGAGFNAIELMARGNATTNTTGYFDNVAILVPGTQSIDKWAYIGHYPNTDEPSRMTTDYFAAGIEGKTEATMYAKLNASYNGKSWLPCNGGVVDFNAIYSPGGTTISGASYLFTYVVNGGAAINDADLTCGSDDGIKVWWNGTPVVSGDTYRSFWLDTDQSAITINPGVNRMLVKITQGPGDYKSQVRLTHANGTPITGLTFLTSDDAGPTGTSISGPPTTTSRSVNLTLSAADALSGMGTMSFSEDNVTYAAPVPYAASYAYTLAVGPDGARNVYVKFVDNAGNAAAPINTTITLNSAPPPPPSSTPVTKISDLWPLANDTTVYSLMAKTVSAVWSDGFWIEEANRFAGVKVLFSGSTLVGASAVAAGDSVDVYGTLSTGTDTRLFTATYVNDHGAAAQPIKALGVIERSAGGKAVNPNTPAITNGKGIYNVGMLVRVAGTAGNAGSNFFYLDDGSKLLDGAIPGMKVICGSLTPATSGHKTVTGVVGISAGKPVLYAISIL